MKSSSEIEVLSFGYLLKISILKANSQILALLKALIVILLYFCRDALIPAAFLAVSYFAHLHGYEFASVLLISFAIAWFLVLAIKYDGAIGCMFAYLPVESSALNIAKKSVRSGYVFFANALNTGVLLLFGQILLICPCFIFLNNFIFSPFLVIYENISGKKAKERSKEIVSGFGPLILYRTASFLFIAYLFLVLSIAIFFIKAAWLVFLVIAIAGIYLSLIQSNFVRQIYLEMLNLRKLGSLEDGIGKKKSFELLFATVLLLLLVVLIYIIFKFLPELALKYR